MSAIPPGYKQTDVGVIPEEWEAVPLKSITPQNRKNGIVDGPFGSNLKTIHYRTSGIPIITSGYVTDGRFYADKYLYVDRAKFLEEKRSAVQPGDIVMAKIGERCGASAILPLTHEIGILSGNALKITVDESRHSTFYVWQVLWNLHISGKMEVLRTTGAQPALSMANLKRYKIPVPPTKAEQNTITTALADADALIAALDKLIAKKRDIKQAAMQQLLTGKKRLPGFSGEWEVKKLGEIGSFSKGKGLSKGELADSGSVPAIPYTAIYTNYAEVIVCSKITHFVNSTRNRAIINGAHLLIAGSSNMLENIGKATAYIANKDVAIGGDIIIYRTSVNICFLSYLLSTRPHRNKVVFLSQGSTIRHVYRSTFAGYEITLPTNREQIAIVNVLSIMDAEIAALEQRLDKTKALKQGMMQALLTGRIRLV